MSRFDATTTDTVLIRWEGARAPTVWTVPRPEIDPVEARRELAIRYLQVFGPTTLAAVRDCPSRKPFSRSPEVHPFPWSYESARRMFERLCERSAVPYEGGLHAFRHTKATALLARGVPDHAVAALLGHSVPALQRTYDHSTALQYAKYLE